MPLAVVVALPTPEIVTLTGTAVPEESSDVASDVAGKVVAVLVQRGDVVNAGDGLIRLDTRNAALTAREAQAGLAAARAQRQLAEDECKRAQALFDKGAITKSQYDREQTTCTATLQEVAAAEARTQMISKAIADGLVRAPFAGTITERWVSPGEWVQPGMRVATLVDADPLRLELSAAEVDVPKLAVGQKVEVEAVAFRGKTFAAEVSRLGAEIGPMTRSLVVEAIVAPGSQLVPGMFVEARVTIGHTDRPAVPKSALVKRGRTSRVFVVKEGRAFEQVVQVGPELAGDKISILQGLAVGDSIVASGVKDLVDGAAIAPAAAK